MNKFDETNIELMKNDLTVFIEASEETLKMAKEIKDDSARAGFLAGMAEAMLESIKKTRERYE